MIWRRRASRALGYLESSRGSVTVLAIAVAVYAALTLWLTREATFTYEEITYFGGANGFDPHDILLPYNGGHLIAITRLLFEVNLRVFGTEQLPFQLVVIALNAATAIFAFLLVRPRVGALPALAAAVVLLFLGTTPEVINGWATMWVQATAAGLAALVALDRRSARADVLACVLLILAVASFSVGVALAIAAGVMLLAAGERRRLWIPLVPLVLYAVWWAWARQFDASNQALDHVLLIPVWSLDSLAAAAAALTGVGVDLTAAPDLTTIAVGWGRIVAVLVLVAVAVGVRRRGPTPLLWGALAFIGVLWVAQGTSYDWTELARRTPDLDRYAYPVAIGIVLVLAAAFDGWKLSPRVAVAVLAIAAFALPVNLWAMRERGAEIRLESDLAKARMAAIEIDRDLVPPDYVAIGPEGGSVPVRAADYLAAVDRYDSLGWSESELLIASPQIREVADETLAMIAPPTLTPARGTDCGGPAVAGGVVEIDGRTLLRSETGGTLELRRFADAPVVEAGALAPGRVTAVDVPLGTSSVPWKASVAAGDLEVCLAG